MDVRSKIIDHVLSSLSDLDSHILNQIEHVLLVQLLPFPVLPAADPQVLARHCLLSLFLYPYPDTSFPSQDTICVPRRKGCFAKLRFKNQNIHIRI